MLREGGVLQDDKVISHIQIACGHTWLLVVCRRPSIRWTGLLSFNAGSEPMLQWDEQIHSVCAQLNNIIDDAMSRRVAAAAS